MIRATPYNANINGKEYLAVFVGWNKKVLTQTVISNVIAKIASENPNGGDFYIEPVKNGQKVIGATWKSSEEIRAGLS